MKVFLFYIISISDLCSILHIHRLSRKIVVRYSNIYDTAVRLMYPYSYENVLSMIVLSVEIGLKIGGN